MKINELLLNEAISLTKYEDDFREAIYTAIEYAVKHEGEFASEIQFNNFDKLKYFLNDTLADRIGDALSYELKVTADKIFGKGTVSIIDFKKMTMGGYTDRLKIVINVSKIYDLAYSVQSLFKYYYIPYTHGKVMSPEDNDAGKAEHDHWLHLMTTLDKSVYKSDSSLQTDVDNLLRTLIHELVHVLQHKAQYDKGREHHAYTSYLNKSPNELIDLLRKQYAGTVSPSDEKRWRQLYAASPQEMGAFVHNIVQEIISEYMEDPSVNLGDLPSSHLPTPQVLMTDIKRHVNHYIRPTNDKEQRVYNRYIKLVYQELDRFLDHLRRNTELKSTGTPSPLPRDPQKPVARTIVKPQQKPSRAAVQLNNYLHNVATNISKVKSEDRNELIGELVTVMTDRRGYPEWGNSVATAKRIIKRSGLPPATINRYIQKLTSR